MSQLDVDEMIARRAARDADAGNPKVYRADFSQTGEAAPTIVVRENTLGGAIVWSRVDVGVYQGTLTGAFPAGRVVISPTFHDYGHIRAQRLDANTVEIATAVPDFATGDPADAVVSPSYPHPIELLVYPED